ncbi:MAG: hypothetical protein WKG07_47665 [Hymenobacter sp.]
MESRVLKGKNATFEASAAFKNIATSSGETLRTSRDILTATALAANVHRRRGEVRGGGSGHCRANGHRHPAGGRHRPPARPPCRS